MTQEERTRLEGYLADAQRAYHLLMTGGRASVFVDSNGERIEYSKTSSSSLAAYISSLQRQLGVGRPLGPMGVIF